MPLVVDIESKSLCDIKKCGAWAYSLHPSTEILCMVGTDTETGETRRVDFRYNDIPVSGLQEQLAIYHNLEWFRNYGTLIAHNVGFEYAMLKNVLGWSVDDILWIDTQDIAAYLGAPLKLEKAAEFLFQDDQAVQKDKKGKKLIGKICTPSNKKKKTFGKYTEEDFQELIDYCEQDVKVSLEIYKQFWHLVPEYERTIMLATQRMNRRGIPVELSLVDKLQDFYDSACDELEVPKGYVTSDVRRTAFMVDEINKLGYGIPNMQAETVEVALKDKSLNGKARMLLEAKQLMTMSSVKKLVKTVMWCDGEDTIKNGFQYHGAKTGRYAGRGVQPQNFVRGFDNDLDIILARAIIGAEI